MRYWSGEVSWNSSTIATGYCVGDALAQRFAVGAFQRRLQAVEHVGKAELAAAPLQFRHAARDAGRRVAVQRVRQRVDRLERFPQVGGEVEALRHLGA